MLFQEEMVFYNDDGSYQTVIVERNLCASDLCQLLALKNRVSKSVNWSIVEHWKGYGLGKLFMREPVRGKHDLRQKPRNNKIHV